MLKAKRILNDLKHNLKGKKRVFNYYDVEHNERESKNLSISSLDIIRALAPYEIDFKKLYGVDFDDVIYEDAQGNYISIDTDYKNSSNNSYNWSSQVVFNYQQVQIITDDYHVNYRGHDLTNHKEYIAIKFHRYGDVRGNYTDYMVLDMSMEKFYEVVAEATSVHASVTINNVDYEITTDCLKEACLFDVWSKDGDDLYDVCLDIDNLRSKKDIKKGLRKYLKENAA